MGAVAAVRPPAVAGMFYPDHPAVLRQVVEDFLAEAGEPEAGGEPAAAAPPKAVIAPHAGYLYSGPVAARAFATLRRAAAGRVRRVVVIGPSHYVAVDGIAAPAVDAFATPLGRVPLDRAAIEAIRGLPGVTIAEAPHRDEHALEVELPFLQVVLGADRFALVPLVVGDAAPAEVAAVLERLWGEEGDETLVVVSSDLSHYHDYPTARRLDAETAALIERRDGARLGPARACGHLPIAGLLVLAAARGLAVERLALRNSGDTAGPRGRVVGYGAWAFREGGAAA